MSVLSDDRNITGKTKLERLGERAVNDQETVFNNLGHLLNRSLFKEIYQQMNGNKAAGIDGVVKGTYGENLDANIDDLILRIRKGTYRPKPFRRVDIPKEDGSQRPLAIASFEDKLVQSAVSGMLTQIYEPLFLSCSYGFRPKVSCHDALKALMKHTYPCWNGAIVEIDIWQCFNSIPQAELKSILQKKISDKRFLQLIDTLTMAPTVYNGVMEINTKGCPQGSILSPILSNIYLHEVIDVWFEEIRRNHIRGIAEEIRYADDMVFVFQHEEEAQRFFRVLPKRLGKYGLVMQQNKSRLIPSGQNRAEAAHRQGKRLPTYQFLGFTVYWGKARNGKWFRLKLKTRSDRFSKKLKGLKLFLKKRLHKDTAKTLRAVIRVVRGWVNYYAVSDNERMVKRFIQHSKQILRKWMNRRGRKRPLNWEKFLALLAKLNYPLTFKTKSLFPKPRGT